VKKIDKKIMFLGLFLVGLLVASGCSVQKSAIRSNKDIDRFIKEGYIISESTANLIVFEKDTSSTYNQNSKTITVLKSDSTSGALDCICTVSGLGGSCSITYNQYYAKCTGDCACEFAETAPMIK
jgi:hypothetical protein